MNSLELLQEMQEARWSGINHFAVYDSSLHTPWELTILKNLPSIKISLESLKDAMLKIENQEIAKNILTSLLHEDMACGVELMPVEKARILTNKFFSLFNSQALYFSNSIWNKNEYAVPAKDFELGLSSWTSLTELTFDSGIIICDNSKTGIIWFSDDD